MTENEELIIELRAENPWDWGGNSRARAADALSTLTAENERLKFLVKGYETELELTGQAAGKALGYPWFKDDPDNFPDATEADGVCIGEHTSLTIVEELAAQNERLRGAMTDPNVVHLNMLRGGIAKPTPAQIGHLYRGNEAAEVVAEVMRQNPEALNPSKEPEQPVQDLHKFSERPDAPIRQGSYSCDEEAEAAFNAADRARY